MSNNCLVSKLKSVVNNSNLQYFDSVLFSTPGNIYGPQVVKLVDNVLQYRLGGPGCVVKAIENCTINYNGLAFDEVTLPPTPNVPYVIVTCIDDTKNADFIIKGKSNIISLYSQSTNNVAIKSGLDSLVNIPANASCDILKFTNDAKVSNTSSFNSILFVDNIRIIRSSRLEGDIANLALCKNLTEVGLAACTNLYGTIEDFVAKLRIAGRTTGTINNFNVYTSKVSFDGSTDNIYGTLSWTDSTITFKGKTIDA